MDLAAIRTNLGLTQAQLAGVTGVHPMTVSKWERGVLRPTRHQRALLVALEAVARGRPARGESLELVGFLN